MLRVIKGIPLIRWLKWALHFVSLKIKFKSIVFGYNSFAISTELGGNTRICDNVYLNNCLVGDLSYVGDNSRVNNALIGKFCSISSNVNIGLGSHPLTYISTSPLFYSIKGQLPVKFADQSYYDELKEIKIGHDVWIGANSVILDGVEIGTGAVIAAGSIVTRDVEPYTIVGGAPAKKLKRRFKIEEINLIEKSEWWNWDQNFLKENFKMFHSIDEFVLLLSKVKKNGS